MTIRKYKPGEEGQLMAVFYSSIHENASAYYNQDQLMAWAPEHMDINRWTMRIQGINPFVVIDDNQIVAYADLQASGYIDHFFVRGGCSKRGYGKALMAHLIEEAKEAEICILTSDVSLAAQAFYMTFGFEIVKRKEVDINGIKLENALMELTL